MKGGQAVPSSDVKDGILQNSSTYQPTTCKIKQIEPKPKTEQKPVNSAHQQMALVVANVI